MDAVEAIAGVAAHIRGSALCYPAATLVADRFEAGWSVSAPGHDPHGGPAAFLIGDCGRIEVVRAAAALPTAQQRFADQVHATTRRAPTQADPDALFATMQTGFEQARFDDRPLIASWTVDDHGSPDATVLRRDEDIRTQIKARQEPIAQMLAALAPAGWCELVAVFSLTVRTGIARLQFRTGQGWVGVQPPPDVVEEVRRLRETSAGMSGGPWWRMMMSLTSQGQLQVDYDYGAQPFPEDQLQPAEHYRDDVETYPRPRLPVWLAGYLAGPTAQGRTPQQAAAALAADQAAGRAGSEESGTLEPLPGIWARWAVLAATYVGAGSQWGPRITPGSAWHEADTGSGACLYVLPGGQAVLSGGRWNSPLLAAAYGHGQPLPDLYTGAPAWVNDSILNPRNQNGLLSFCYWWQHSCWRRGAADTAADLIDALPPIWTPDDTVAAMTAVVGPGVEHACTALVDTAAAHDVTRGDLSGVFSQFRDPDLDGAWNQLSLAGLTR